MQDETGLKTKYKMNHKILTALIMILVSYHIQAQQETINTVKSNTMTKKKVINKDVHFSVGGQKCFRKAIDIPIHSIEEKLILLQKKRGFSIKSAIGRPLGGVTQLDCAEIETWKSIPEYETTRVYAITKELIVVVKDVQGSELILITFMGNNYAEIKKVIEELELNIVENSEAEKLKLLEDESRITERIRLIIDAKILISIPMFPYHHYFVDNSGDNSIKSDIGVKEKTFFLENRKYDLLLIFNFE